MDLMDDDAPAASAHVIDELLCYAELEIRQPRTELAFKTANGIPTK